ncbi:MAG: hypothetical protein E6K03_10220 [Methanobacteriota archaeon]|nr:MAG: hypothetical protein E6K17_02315 [Euryarchaeota archaeon]TLZ81512.1 MAG: hypothetical protein E6K03_10220 [Euryarchaeota archaeon]
MAETGNFKLLKMTDIRVGVGCACKAATVRLGSTTFKTPIRALGAAKSPTAESRIVTAPASRGLNEVYRRVSPEAVDSIDGDSESQQRFQSDLVPGYLRQRLNIEGLLVVLSLEQRTKTAGWETWMPTKKQTEFLAFFLSGVPYDHIVVPPILRGVPGDVYLKFLRTFFDVLPSLRRTTLAGLIPGASNREISGILDFYMQRGLNAFVVDFEGKSPLSNWSLLPHLSSFFWKVADERGEYFAHAINAKHRMRRDQTGVVPARDLLLYYETFDSVGGVHTTPVWNREFREKVQSGQLPPAVPRLLDTTSYGYRFLAHPRSEISSAASALGLSNEAEALLSASVPEAKVADLLNAARVGEETRRIERHIREGDELTYLESKAAVVKELGKVRKMREAFGPGLRDTSINDFI